MADPSPTVQMPSELPVLPLREAVAFPLTVIPLMVNRPVSVDAVNRALSAGNRMVFLSLQSYGADAFVVPQWRPRRSERSDSARRAASGLSGSIESIARSAHAAASIELGSSGRSRVNPTSRRGRGSGMTGLGSSSIASAARTPDSSRATPSRP